MQVWGWDALTKAKSSIYTYTSTYSGSSNGDITWSPDSKYLAFTISPYPGGSSTSPVQTSTVQVWNALTQVKSSIYTYTSPSSSSSVGSITWSPNGKYLAFTTSTVPGGSSTSPVQTNTAQVWVWDALTKAKSSIYTSTTPAFYSNSSITSSPSPPKYL